MRAGEYDPKKRKEIVARLMKGGKENSVPNLHYETHIPETTLRRWKADAQAGIYDVPHTGVEKPASAPDRSCVLVIPDMHHPFVHKDALDFLLAVRHKYHPSVLMCLGDEIDAHAFSRYPMDPDGMTAGKELQAAIESLLPFYRAFPDILICESNHTVRPWKKAFEAGLPSAFMPTVSKIMQAPDGWVWKPRHIVDGVLYTHGDNGRSGQYAAVHYMKQAKRPVVIGHIHAFASVFYEGPHFAMNTGCLIDVEAYCFKYAKHQLLEVSLGCGIVIGGREAYFIPMICDDSRRWIGTL
jgi:hypothetical protein